MLELTYRMVFSPNHGCICSCLGPIIDVQLKSKVFFKEKFLIIQIRQVFFDIRDLFLPSVYDALLVRRPSWNFRDGTVIQNYTANFRQYFLELPFQDAYFFSLLHLIPAHYSSIFHSFFLEMCLEISELNQRDIILGFASVFFFIKSYASFLVGELSQLCYKGVLRTIALGSTDGLSTWRLGFLMIFQPVIVPVGRIALGRIFNVVGSIIDPYMDLSLSSQFHTSCFACSEQSSPRGVYLESHENVTYTFSYPNHIFIFTTRNFKLKYLCNTMIMNTIFFDWIFSIAYFSQNFT
jgi:hypothetical protein